MNFNLHEFVFFPIKFKTGFVSQVSSFWHVTSHMISLSTEYNT